MPTASLCYVIQYEGDGCVPPPFDDIPDRLECKYEVAYSVGDLNKVAVNFVRLIGINGKSVSPGLRCDPDWQPAIDAAQDHYERRAGARR